MQPPPATSVRTDFVCTRDRMRVFVAATDLTDAAIDCQEGRQVVFVDPDVSRGLALTSAAEDVVPALLASDTYAALAR
jgi:hypothetical protein